MINSDRMEPIFEKYDKEYDFNFQEGFILKNTTSKEAIKALLIFKTTDNDILNYKDILGHHLVSEFKKTDCYKSKTEAERQEIIDYLLDSSNIEEFEEPNYTDENGNDINI